MAEANCATFGCSTSRKHKIFIFKVSAKDNEYNIDWTKKILMLPPEIVLLTRIETNWEKCPLETNCLKPGTW